MALTLVLMTACSTGPGPDKSAQPASGSTRVSPDDAATLHLAGGLAVSVPRGTVAGDGTLLGTTGAAPGAAPRGMTLAGPTYDLRIAQTRLTGRVRLTVPVPSPAASGPAAGPDDALLAFYDTAEGRWQPVAATYHPATHSLTAMSPHLSLWSALRLDAGTVLSQATSLLKGFIGAADTTAQPTCQGTSQLSAAGIKTTSDKGNLVKWCAGVDASGAPLLRVADNRSYAMGTTYPTTWSAARAGPADPIARQVIDSLARLLSPAPHGEASIIIPGGGTVQFTAPLGTSGEARTMPSGEGYLIDAFVYGADTLGMTMDDIPGAPGGLFIVLSPKCLTCDNGCDKPAMNKPPASNPTKTAKAISLAFNAKDCLTQLDAIVHNDVSSAHAVDDLFRSDVELAVGCLKNEWKIAYGLKGALGSFIINALLWLEDGIKLVLNGLHAAIDNAIYWRSYRIALPAGQGPVVYVPCCGLPGPEQKLQANRAEHYRPRTVDFDATGSHVLQNATWQVWNATEAVAVGTASINSCEPACAGGRYYGDPVIVTLSEPQKCDGSWFWSKAVWHFPSGIPPGETQNQTMSILFGC